MLEYVNNNITMEIDTEQALNSFCIFLEINDCAETGACPENANCTDLLGRCQYKCNNGFEGLTCSGKQYVIFQN